LLLAVVALAGSLVWALRKVDTRVQPPPYEVPKLPPKPVYVGAEAEEQAADEPPAPVAVGGVASTLDRRKLEDGLAKVRPHLQRCKGLGPYSGVLFWKLTIQPTGAMSSAQLSTTPEPAPPAPLVDCLAKVFKTATFPRFSNTVAPTVEWIYPLTLKDF
jgi:hypothetical protein